MPLLPEGMSGAEDLVLVTYEMLKRGYSEKDIRKVLGENFLRAFEGAENTAKNQLPQDQRRRKLKENRKITMVDRREFIQLATVTSLAAMAPIGTAVSAQSVRPGFSQTFALNEATIADLQQKMQSGDMQAEEITRAYIRRIGSVDRNLNSVIELNPEAVAIAESLDRERKAGKVRSMLHGIPVLIKDNIDTADKMKTTAGSLALSDSPVPKQDAFLVKQLREAGAVILGKTNLSEWANFGSSSSSSGWSGRGGQTHNPSVFAAQPVPVEFGYGRFYRR